MIKLVVLEPNLRLFLTVIILFSWIETSGYCKRTKYNITYDVKNQEAFAF